MGNIYGFHLTWTCTNSTHPSLPPPSPTPPSNLSQVTIFYVQTRFYRVLDVNGNSYKFSQFSIWNCSQFCEIHTTTSHQSPKKRKIESVRLVIYIIDVVVGGQGWLDPSQQPSGTVYVKLNYCIVLEMCAVVVCQLVTVSSGHHLVTPVITNE